MFEVRFDQGPMGHARRKPTRLGTNLHRLRELEGMRGQEEEEKNHMESPFERGSHGRDPGGARPQGRFSRGSARGTAGEGLCDEEAGPGCLEETPAERASALYSRECKSCVIAASRGRAQKRIPHADA